MVTGIMTYIKNLLSSGDKAALTWDDEEIDYKELLIRIRDAKPGDMIPVPRKFLTKRNWELINASLRDIQGRREDADLTTS